MIRNLAYIGFRSPNADEWRSFGPEVLGAELAPDGPDGAVRLRVDDAAHRIVVHPGSGTSSPTSAGRSTTSTTTARALDAAGITVDDGAFVDPFGFRHELVAKVEQGPPFTPGRPMSGFVTGEQGLGHVVLIVPDLDAGRAFFTDVLGFRLSDAVESGLSLRFLHCAGHAARHHTVALASVPGMVGMHHLMLEVRSLDDVGTALDVVNERRLHAGDDARTAHQRPDDVVLRPHAIRVRDRVRHRRPRRRRRHLGGRGASLAEHLGPPASRRAAVPGHPRPVPAGDA